MSARQARHPEARAHVSGAGFSLVGRDKRTPEDRWALAELGPVVVAAVADGLSDPLGDGRTGASGAVADHAVAAFVERASELVEAGRTDPAEVAATAFEAAELAARSASLRLGGAGAAAFVGACLDARGCLALVKVGDVRAFIDAGDGAWHPATPSDDADRSGALTAFFGPRPVASPVVVHHRVTRALLLSDGAWRVGPPAAEGPGLASRTPFALARDLVARARRAGETDDLSAVALQRAPAQAPFFEALSPLMFAVASVLFVLAGLLIASLWADGGAS